MFCKHRMNATFSEADSDWIFWVVVWCQNGAVNQPAASSTQHDEHRAAFASSAWSIPSSDAGSAQEEHKANFKCSFGSESVAWLFPGTELYLSTEVHPFLSFPRVPCLQRNPAP